MFIFIVLVDCLVEDKWVCGRDWIFSYCKWFINVFFDCFYMCGKCGSGSSSGIGSEFKYILYKKLDLIEMSYYYL